MLNELNIERELMAKVAFLKLQYFGHVTRGRAGQLALTVLEGTVEGKRYQGKPRREYLKLKKMAEDRKSWRWQARKWSSAVANPQRGWSINEINESIQTTLTRSVFDLRL